MNKKYAYYVPKISIDSHLAKTDKKVTPKLPPESARKKTEALKAMHDLYIKNSKKPQPISNLETEQDNGCPLDTEESYQYRRSPLDDVSPCENCLYPEKDLMSSTDILSKFLKRSENKVFLRDQPPIILEDNTLNEIVVRDIVESCQAKESQATHNFNKTLLYSISEITVNNQNDSNGMILKSVMTDDHPSHNYKKFMEEMNELIDNTSKPDNASDFSSTSLKDEQGMITEIEEIMDKVERQITRSKSVAKSTKETRNSNPELKYKDDKKIRFSEPQISKTNKIGSPDVKLNSADLKNMNYSEITNLLESIKRGFSKF